MQVRVEGTWQPISHATILDRVRRIALGLDSIGVKRGDRVAILSENRPEWALADYACLTSGFTDVPLYATLPAEQLPYIISAGIGGMFLLGLGAMLWLSADLRDEWRKLDRIERRLGSAPAAPAPVAAAVGADDRLLLPVGDGS